MPADAPPPDAPPADALLTCEGLVKTYRGGKKAVRGIDFHVGRGEIVGLLGPNGAGKSTTFRMACGLTVPTEGRVTLTGTDVTKWPLYRRARRGMGYLPQDDSVFKKLSVEANLFAVLEFQPIARAAQKKRADGLLEQFGLADKRRQTAGTLSGGERRRLEIARCLASKPDLILLDEPFTGIDAGISILLTDHRERETLTITDRSYIVCEGKVLVSGSARQVLSDPTAQEKYFGSRFDAGSILEGRDAFDGPRRRAA